jgi:isoamylase
MAAELPTVSEIGTFYPLGATFDGRGTNFAVFAGGAERVHLCLFDPAGNTELRRLVMPECTHGVWHAYLPGVGPGQLYGYRADGPYEPVRGLRYNGNKLLIDPYARQLAGTLRWSDAVYGYRRASPRADLSFDRRDSASAVPKAVVTHDPFDWGDDRPPRTAWSQTVIYEAHLRGLTMKLDGIPPAQQGTAAALGHARTIDYLQRLGVTAIELLPIHAMLNDHALAERGLTNYWGYNTLAFFAPERRYLCDGTLAELKRAIRNLHAAGIEVLLDVVYNHTAEGSELGPTLSMRGLDNMAYYRLEANSPRQYVNDTGTGNTVNFSHPRVIALTLDSLRYWVQEFHVDGFRFDLSSTLGREATGYDQGSGFFDALMQDPTLACVKLIGEPWDTGPGGYQVGNHPPGMAEWNDKFRDDVRRYWRGDSSLRGALAARLQGSSDVFDHQGRKPWASINFITAHDGFTLEDWVSYERKYNDANGEQNRDGTDNNLSRNWGEEGESQDGSIRVTRARVKRAMLATLLFSHGTPMLLGGDEFGRSQHGNNNAYAQDNEISWLNWTALQSEAGVQLHDYVARLIRLRREYRTLHSSYYQHGLLEPLPQIRDAEWFDENGDTMRAEDWQNPQGRFLCLRRAVPLDAHRTEITLLLTNNTDDVRTFQLPDPPLSWWLRLDSGDPGGAEHRLPLAAIDAGPHSVLLLTTIDERQPAAV